jgi:hypothetical protein
VVQRKYLRPWTFTAETLPNAGCDSVYNQPVLAPNWKKGEKEECYITDNQGNKHDLSVCVLGYSIRTGDEGVTVPLLEVVRRGYYYYKQITRVGQPGMAVAQTMAMDSEIAVIAFSSNGTHHPDAFIVINIDDDDRKVAVTLSGTDNQTFEALRTVDRVNRYKNLDYELYAPIGEFEVNQDDQIIYLAPANSVATFFGN